MSVALLERARVDACGCDSACASRDCVCAPACAGVLVCVCVCVR